MQILTSKPISKNNQILINNIHPLYINKDVSWINFNNRVLNISKDQSKHISERIRFLAISAHNLDSFFMVRIGNIYNQIKRKYEAQQCNDNDEQYLTDLLEKLKKFQINQQKYYTKNLKELKKSKYCIIKKFAVLNKKNQESIKQHFLNNILPNIKVINTEDQALQIENKLLTIGIVLKTKKEKEDNKDNVSFIQIPQNISRFHEITQDKTIYFIPVEQIIKRYLKKIYPKTNIYSSTTFRITRNSQFSINQKGNIESKILEEIKKRTSKTKEGTVVRLEIEKNYDSKILDFLTIRFNIGLNNIFINEKKNLIDLSSLTQITNHINLNKKLKLNYKNIPATPFNTKTTNIFETIKKQDILLHHPYNNMYLVINLLKKSADDPNVLSIKLTVYRLAKNSKIIKSLIKAAKNRKKVYVLFEVRARFDEQNNIKAAKKLQKAGCHITYSIGEVKTHTKLLSISRKEKGEIVNYVHFSTGNYNEETAKIYTDTAILTTKKEYGQDISNFFNLITGSSSVTNYDTLITAPINMRESIISLIQNEILNKQKGLPTGIIIKANSLEDEEIINELYKASQQGVIIKLIIRGICCLIPGVKELSENIKVYSIIGKFLEHSRIFYFHNQGDPKIYIGSADLMMRSLDKRIESLIMVKDSNIKKQLINILDYNLKDNHNSYIMRSDGKYVKKSKDKNHNFNIHEKFWEVTHNEKKQQKTLINL